MEKRGVVLITGGSGMIGRRLSELLNNSGYSVRILSRKRVLVPGARVYLWDHSAGFIEEGALDGITILIHLAGTNIGSARWDKKGRESIVESRVHSARFLHKQLTEKRIRPDLFISASAIGYYGAVTSSHIFTEEDPPGKDFASTTAQLWESEARRFVTIAERVAIIRTGIVLSASGGMLQKIIPTVKMHFSPLFGKGDQWVPWIHIDDIAAIYMKVIKDSSLTGVINGVSPSPLTYSGLVRELSAVMEKPVLSLPTPKLIWKIIFGSKADILLHGSRVSSEKIEKSGFKFSYPEIKPALINLLSAK